MPTTNASISGDMVLQLTPLVPLQPNTSYTLNIAGAVDVTGNPLNTVSAVNFTTAASIDLTPPALTSVTPANGASSVPVTTRIVAVFSKAMDPVWFNSSASFALIDPNGNVVPATISFSPDYKTVTFTPVTPLTSGVLYYFYYSYYYGGVYLTDFAGNPCGGGSISFTTQ